MARLAKADTAGQFGSLWHLRFAAAYPDARQPWTALYTSAPV